MEEENPLALARLAAANSWLRDEIERLRLTDEEREALHWFAHYGLPERRAAAIRGLLERLAR